MNTVGKYTMTNVQMIRTVINSNPLFTMLFILPFEKRNNTRLRKKTASIEYMPYPERSERSKKEDISPISIYFYKHTNEAIESPSRNFIIRTPCVERDSDETS